MFKGNSLVGGLGRCNLSLPTVGLKQTLPEPIQEGLVFYYDLSDSNSYIPGSTHVFNVLNKEVYPATLLGTPSFNNLKPKSLIYGEESVNALDLGDVLDNVITGASASFSYQCWVKTGDLLPDVGYQLLSKAGDSNFNENQRQLFFVLRDLTSYNYNGLRIEVVYYGALNGSSYRAGHSRSYVIPSNEVVCLGFSYDGSINTNDGLDRLEFYINGYQQTIKKSFTNGSLLPIPEGQARMAIGAMLGQAITNTPRSVYLGELYNAAFYNRTLSKEEFYENFNRQNKLFSLPTVWAMYPPKQSHRYTPSTVSYPTWSNELDIINSITLRSGSTFNGDEVIATSSYATFAGPIIPTTADFTFSIYAKVTADNTFVPFYQQAGNGRLAVFFTTVMGIDIYSYDGVNSVIARTDYPPVVNTYYYMCYIREDNTFSLYIDGILIAQSTVPGVSIAQSTTYLLSGGASNGGAGAVKYLALSKQPLTMAEINNEYQMLLSL